MSQLPPSVATGRSVLVGLLALVLAACGGRLPGATFSPIPPDATGGAPSGSPAASATPSVSAPGLLLEVTSEGGFINPLVNLSAVPLVVVEDDGHIYTPAADPVSLVTPVSVRDVGSDGAARIRDAIRTAGLDHDQSGGGIAVDTGSVVFTVVVDGTTSVSRFVRTGGGPGVPGGDGGPGVPGGDGAGAGGSPGSGGAADAGAAAFALLARLTDPADAWGAPSAPVTAYVPVGYRVYEAPAGSAATDGATAAWPLPAGPGAFGSPAVPDFGVSGLRSGTVTGADALALRTALEAATPDTAFTSGGAAYTLWVRPLFPDELNG